ncbi:sulfite exporter TauE/SafE family protein [bacterium]|nr:MAG: sulfite exporter TauE/SafE family protein [bacterium]
MNIYTLLILVLVGLITGAFGGMLGIGGGLILIPALVYFVGLNQHQAIGTSLAVMLPPIGLFAAYNYYKAGQVNLKYALILAIAFMVGSYFTSKIAIKMPENIIKKVFSIFLVLIAIKMFFSK